MAASEGFFFSWEAVEHGYELGLDFRVSFDGELKQKFLGDVLFSFVFFLHFSLSKFNHP
jgi:hypothetical protein